MNMKEKRKILILTLLVIMLVILITCVIALFITHKQNTNNIEMINYWTIYKQEIVNNNKIINVINTNGISINIKEKKLEICYINKEKEKCDSVKYTYQGNTLSILEEDTYLNGTYNVILEDTTMILEKIENEENNVKIKNYFQKAEG